MVIESSSSKKEKNDTDTAARSELCCDRNVEGKLQQECCIDQLSDDLVLTITEHLGLRDLVSLQSVNKRLYNVTSTPSLWKRLYPSLKDEMRITKVFHDPKTIERHTEAGMNEWKAACVELLSASRGKQTAQDIKMMAVGDTSVGKASTFKAFTVDEPTIFGIKRERTWTKVLFRGKLIHLEFWDVSGGGESYGRLRPVSYPGTDVFLLLYSCVSPSSLHHITSRWYPEIIHHCPNVPIVLAATKHDLKDSSKEELEEKKLTIVTPDNGRKLSKELKCYDFIEYSSVTQYNLDKVFEICLEAATTPVPATVPAPTPQEKKREKCRVM